MIVLQKNNLSHNTENVLHRSSFTEQVQFISGVKKWLQSDGCWEFVGSVLALV